jgi:predicted nucleotidyltransferase
VIGTLPTHVTAAVSEYAAALRNRFGEELLMVRVFGSYARGEADEESDVDVAVVLDRVDWARQAEVIDLATDAGLPRELRLSPALFDRATWELWREQERALVVDIEREGISA